MTPPTKRDYQSDAPGLHGYGGVGLGDSDIDWSSILNTAIGGGVQIAKQLTLPAGTYVQTPQGVMSSAGLPVNASFGNPLGGISSSTLLLLGGGFLLVMLLSRR